jgi:acetyltransferase-like isoleucine patch superfamily enzyme
LRCAAAAGLRSLLRLAGNHCFIPSLRVFLFRCSGVRIGRDSRVNMSTNFLDDFRSGLIEIGEEASLAPFVSIVASAHPNNSPLLTEFGMRMSGKVRILRGAWLGVGCVILPGITVGQMAVVGANSVVTRDVEDFAIVTGAPARKIGDVREWKARHEPGNGPSSDAG